MVRSLLFAFWFAPFAVAQNQPVFQWVEQIDSSAGDSFAGLGVDGAGNIYIAGSTSSANFPVKNAVQPQPASAGLYQVRSSGSAYSKLDVSSASFVAIDPKNPNTLYVVSSNNGSSSNGVLKSVNGGASFTRLTLPSMFIETLAIDPSNDRILYAGTFDQGLLKSTDGGLTWTTSNGSLQPLEPGQFEFEYVWIDPNHPDVVFANAIGKFIRSADGGATWQIIFLDTDIINVTFDAAIPGLVYATTNQGMASVSTDDGQTFSSLSTPAPFGTVLADPTQTGRLLGLSTRAIYVSANSGMTWTVGVNLSFPVNYVVFAADWANGFLYAASSSSVVRISANLQTVTPVGPPSTGFISSIAAANGIAYVASVGTRDVYVTKLDPSGNIVYSTYFGGSNDDAATAIAVDQSGNVYVTGITSSLDFPVTKGAYASSGASFVFKLNPQGAVVYSTYFQPSGNPPSAVAVDDSGAVYLGGTSTGGLVTTAGAYQPTCSSCGISSNGFFGVVTYSGFASKLDSGGATLNYSTYIGSPVQLMGHLVTAVSAATDGSAYYGGGAGGAAGIWRLNASGSGLLASISLSGVNFQTLALAADGSLYVAGTADTFPTTPGTFEPSVTGPPPLLGQNNPVLPATVIAHYDSQLAQVLAATFFGAGRSINAIAFDSGGNLYIGGATSPQRLPTRTPIQLGFASQSGFVSELTRDLSALLFSSYFGDSQGFAVEGLAVAKTGGVLFGGPSFHSNFPNIGPAGIWVNSLTLTPPPSLRIDSVVNAASLLDGPISAGETVIVEGAGFGSDAQLSIGGVTAQAISITPTAITAAVPPGIPAGAAYVQVESGGASSNQVPIPTTATSPGIFSQNGSGFGQGYILNKDGTLNTPSNPAAPGDPITIYATGVGPVSFTQGYAVTQFPVNVFIESFYCDGISATMGPVQGLPGSVYRISVYVPTGFTLPVLAGVIMQIDGVSSQLGTAVSISR